jgi:mono/diheme cytochrome c family protein
MRMRLILPTALCLLTLGLTVAAAPAPEAYVKNMKDLGTALAKIRGGVEAKDFTAVAADAAVVQALLKSTQTFWEQRKVDDAIAQSQTAVKAAKDIAAAAKAKDEAAIAAGLKVLNGTCAACHTAHRDRTPDGKYGIK